MIAYKLHMVGFKDEILLDFMEPAIKLYITCILYIKIMPKEGEALTGLVRNGLVCLIFCITYLSTAIYTSHIYTFICQRNCIVTMYLN